MTTKNKIIISLITLGLVNLLFISLVIYPLFSGVRESSRVVSFQKEALAKTEIKIQNLRKFQNIFSSYQSTFDKIDKLFINSREPIDFIEFLEKEAANSRVSIEISPFPLKIMDGDNWPSMNFSLTIIGSSLNFLKFLEKLEASPYLVEILNLNSQQSPEMELKTSLLIKAYAK